MQTMYVIGSLRNPEVPKIAQKLREINIDAFDDWYAAGPEADDSWKDYEVSRGRNYSQALSGYAAAHVFAFDKFHLDRVHSALLVLPAGRSGHLELGYVAGLGKPTYILLAGEPDRFDVMYQFASGGVFNSTEEMLEKLK